MQRDRVTGNMADRTDVDKAADEIVASSVIHVSGLDCLSLARSRSQLPQYISPRALHVDSTDLDQPGQDYFSITPYDWLPSPGGADYNLTAIPEPDWPMPSYFSETTSPAPFTASIPLSGYSLVAPEDLAGNASTSWDPISFSSISGGVCPSGSASVAESRSTQAKAPHNRRLVESAMDVADCSPVVSPESKYFRGISCMTRPQLGPSTSRISPARASGLEFDGDNVAEGGTGNKAQLRTAFRKAKTKRRSSHSSTISGKQFSPEAEDEQEDLLTPEERRARHSHNIVEKQYRNRLNAQFVRLLAALPAADQRDWSSGGDGAISDTPATPEKRVSKAEVLDLATKRIKALEEQRSRLEEENSELMSNVDAMTHAIVRRGLGKMD